MAHKRKFGRLAAALAVIGAAPGSAAAVDVPALPQAIGFDGISLSAVQPSDWRITPSVFLRETWSDNVNLAAGSAARSDFVTEIGPGVHISRRGPRLLFDFDYRLTQLLYASDTERNRTQNELSAGARLEAIERFFFIDARAVVQQQNVSAVGVLPASNVSDNANQTETRTFSVTPSLRGQIAGVAEYRLAYTTSTTKRDTVGLGDGTSRILEGQIASLDPYRNVSWALEINDRRDDFTNGLDTESQVARAILTYHVSPQLRVSGRVGREQNDFFGPKRSKTIHGFGFEWTPTERTLISGQNEQRFFGRAFNYIVRHRTPRSVWSVQAVKDVTTANDLRSQGQIASFLTQLSQAGATAEQIRQIFQGGNGSVLGVLSSRVFVERSTDASVALIGLRNTLTIGVNQRVSERIGQFQGLFADDFSRFERIDQRSARVALDHRLTPLSNLNLVAATTRTQGAGATRSDSRQDRLDGVVSTAFGPDVTGSFGARHVRFDGGDFASDYRENAVFGGVTVRF